MNHESLDPVALDETLRERANRVAPRLVSGDTTAALIFGYVILGQYVVALEFPETPAALLLLGLVLFRLKQSQYRYRDYLNDHSLKRSFAALAIALGLAAITLALAVILGSFLPDPLVFLLLLALCAAYTIYKRRLLRRLDFRLPLSPRWLWLSTFAFISGTTLLALTSLFE